MNISVWLSSCESDHAKHLKVRQISVCCARTTKFGRSMQTDSPHQCCEFCLPSPSTPWVMGLRNFGEIFNPQKLPFVVPPQLRLWQTICSPCRAEFNSFYLTSLSRSVPEILMRVKIGQNWHIQKFKNSLHKISPWNFFSFQIYVVPWSLLENALIAISQIFQFRPPGGKVPFFPKLGRA